MKKRRTAIVSFLIIAVLVMGIGFAAVVDELSIVGNTTFRPSSLVDFDTATAVHFDKSYGTNGVELSFDANSEIFKDNGSKVDETLDPNLDSATLSVGISGQSGVTDYEYVAIYKVVYEEEVGTQNLSTVYVTVESSITDAGVAVDGFDIDANLYTDEAGSAIVTEMNPGDVAYAIVTVTYTEQGATADVIGTVDVSLSFDNEAPTP